jgi:uncharacterized protein YhdP
MHITAAPKGDALELDVDSAAAAGHFSVPETELSKRGITARLQRLYWLKEPVQPGKKPGAPVVQQIDPANTGMDPAGMPPMHIWVSDLRLDDAKLGQARLETWPTSNGMHIDQLSTQSKSAQVKAAATGTARLPRAARACALISMRRISVTCSRVWFLGHLPGRQDARSTQRHMAGRPVGL